jgi:sugar phosphate isomerase/epimerase
MDSPVSRRQLLATGVAGAIAAPSTVGRAAETTAERAASVAKPVPLAFRYCLNTATLRGQKLSITELVAIAHRAGYQGIEPWIDELDRLVAAGGSLPDLRKQIADAGLRVESAIGFAQWCVDDPAARQKGLEEARRTMGLVAEIGGTRIAAPPAGGTDKRLDPRVLAERYAALLKVGEAMGVVPIAEIWGGSQTMNRLGEVAQIAIDSGHASAGILPDVYHLYKGGSGYTGLALLGSHTVPVLHMNDYPAVPGRSEITDAARVYPGDGVAPWGEIRTSFRAMGFAGALSLELFNRDYWQQDPLGVALTGLAKMKAVMENMA